MSPIHPRVPKVQLNSALSLGHFIQRTKVLALYRSIIRSSRNIPDSHTRRETILYVKNEFNSNQNVKDLKQIRYLVSTGKSQWQRAEKFLVAFRTM